MLLIQSILDKEDLIEVQARIGTLAESPKPDNTRKVRDNRPAFLDDAKTRALTGWLKTVISRNPLVNAYAWPLRFSSPILARYTENESSGLHSDDALMVADDGARLRSDLSFMLFLSPKDAYDGGALCLEASDGTRDVRLEAGDMVIYRTGMLHQILPVTRGAQLVCVGWIQSLTADSEEREILFDLQRLIMNSEDTVQRLVIQKTLGNLLRMWSKT